MLRGIEGLIARNKIKKFLNENICGKDIPLIPGTTRQQTIDMVSSEIADILERSDIPVIQSGTPEQQQQVLDRIIEEIQRRHPAWPVEQWVGLLGAATGADTSGSAVVK